MPPRARTRANSGVRIPRCAVTHGGPTASKDTSPSRPLLPAPPTCELKLDSREDWSPETSVLAPCIFSDAAFARGARESTTPVSFSLSCACFAASAALVCAVAAALRSHSISPRLLLRLLPSPPFCSSPKQKPKRQKPMVRRSQWRQVGHMTSSRTRATARAHWQREKALACSRSARFPRGSLCTIEARSLTFCFFPSWPVCAGGRSAGLDRRRCGRLRLFYHGRGLA